jgi:hypothetical protein
MNPQLCTSTVGKYRNLQLLVHPMHELSVGSAQQQLRAVMQDHCHDMRLSHTNQACWTHAKLTRAHLGPGRCNSKSMTVTPNIVPHPSSL